MKKIFITLICLSLVLLNVVACTAKEMGEEKEKTTTTPGIELTVENIEDYIDFDGSVEATDTTRCYYKAKWIYLYSRLECSLSAKGNTNYEFHDVVIGIKFYHIVPITGETSSEKTVYMKLNLAGNGSTSCKLETPAYHEDYDNISSITYAFYSSNGISSALDSTSYEIVSVTGTATRN